MFLRQLMPLIVAFICLGVGHAEASDPAPDTITIFAAASTQPAMDALIPRLQSRGITLRLVYAASSTLARQIAAGAPADLYVSANKAWMDDLDNKGLIAQATRTTVATNQLVLIAHLPLSTSLQTHQGTIGPDYPLGDILHGDRLAIANPDHVPAGIYARQALTTLGLWSQVEGHLARAQDVTGALLLVARGETRLGAVYASDAARTPNVQTIATFPKNSHAPIVYPAAIVQEHDSPTARKVLAALTGPAGQGAFHDAGFGPAP
jgi:molybdate transport system substrate-binding protein